MLTDELRGERFVPGASVRLVIEVAQTAAEFFLGAKLRAYARHGIPEYWIADLTANRIVRMWAPKREGYLQRDEWAFGDRVEAAMIVGLGIDTANLT